MCSGGLKKQVDDPQEPASLPACSGDEFRVRYSCFDQEESGVKNLRHESHAFPFLFEAMTKANITRPTMLLLRLLLLLLLLRSPPMLCLLLRSQLSSSGCRHGREKVTMCALKEEGSILDKAA